MSNSLPVYILDRTPGAEGRTVAWQEISGKHGLRGKVILIQHCEYLDEDFSSADRCRPRSRQFVVRDRYFQQISSHYTLAAAEKAAANWAIEFAPKAVAA